MEVSGMMVKCWTAAMTYLFCIQGLKVKDEGKTKDATVCNFLPNRFARLQGLLDKILLPKPVLHGCESLL
jgi:hypothetical protein